MRQKAKAALARGITCAADRYARN